MEKPVDIITTPLSRNDIEHLDNIELLFFAYRDFISDPDQYLSEYGFGRAHHRILFFVNRSPGLAVAELLQILQITKQSLGRVLKQLITEEYIIQTTGEDDRRKRLLFPTTKGRDLILSLSRPQTRRMANAFSALDEAERDAVVKFLKAMTTR